MLVRGGKLTAVKAGEGCRSNVKKNCWRGFNKIALKIRTWVLVASMMASYSPLMSRRARANSLEKAEAKASDPRSMDIRAFTFSSYMLVRKAISSSLVWNDKGGDGRRIC